MGVADACRRFLARVIAGQLVGLLAVLLPSAGAAAAPPNFLVIVVDTLRADRLGAYGNRRGLTPVLDRLAARGTVFANAYAPSAWTCPSIASLFTARLPTQHGVVGIGSTLPDAELTLAEHLGAAGYRAAGLSANFRLTSAHGYGQGFTFWGVYLPRADEGSKARGASLRADADGWLQANWVGNRPPTLLYLQYLEPHAPYQAPAALRQRFAPPAAAATVDAVNAKLLAAGPIGQGLSPSEVALLGALYDAEVAAADAEIGALLERLTALGFLDHAVIVVTADHGEEFAEHGRMLHGSTLYNEAIRVPLIVAGAGVAAGRVAAQPVSLIDVAPTLTALAGAPPAARFVGTSFGAALDAALDAAAPAAAVSAPLQSELPPTGEDADLRLHDAAVVDGMHKALRRLQGPPELYDLAADPGEHAPLAAGTWPALVGRLERVPSAAAVSVPAAVPLDEATKEKLRALGYTP